MQTLIVFTMRAFYCFIGVAVMMLLSNGLPVDHALAEVQQQADIMWVVSFLMGAISTAVIGEQMEETVIAKVRFKHFKEKKS